MDYRTNETVAADHIAGEIMQFGSTLIQTGDEREFTRASHYAKDQFISFRVVITPEILAAAEAKARNAPTA